MILRKRLPYTPVMFVLSETANSSSNALKMENEMISELINLGYLSEDAIFPSDLAKQAQSPDINVSIQIVHTHIYICIRILYNFSIPAIPLRKIPFKYTYVRKYIHYSNLLARGTVFTYVSTYIIVICLLGVQYLRTYVHFLSWFKYSFMYMEQTPFCGLSLLRMYMLAH